MTVIIWSWKPNKPRKHTNPHLHAHYNLLLWFSCSVVSNSLRPHGLQHARLPCVSLSPGVYSNSIVAFSSCPQSFPAWGSFPVSQLFTPGVQTIGSLVSASVLPMNIQGWFPLRLRHEAHLIFLGLFILGQENKLNWPLKVKRSSLHSSS